MRCVVVHTVSMAGMAVAATVLFGYLIGSVPVARLVTRSDLRTMGDGNPGYWNARQMLGTRTAFPVFVGDVVKGALAAAMGRLLAVSDWVSTGATAGAAGHYWWLGYLGGFAAMVGHAWPVFDRFRGGRSVLCFVGAACVLSPITALVAALIAVGVWATTRSFAWGARVGVFAFPLVQLIVDGPVRTAATGVLMCLVGLRFWQAARSGQHQPPRDADERAVLGG